MRAPLRERGILALALVLAACGGTGMSLSFQRTIPKNASSVHLRSDLPVNDLFTRVQSVLLEQGYSFPRVDSAGHSLETDALPVGASKSPLRVNIAVHPDSAGGSTVDAIAQTLVGQGIWGPARNGGDQRARKGFQELVLLLAQLPNREVTYTEN